MNLWTRQNLGTLLDRAQLAIDAALLDEASADLDAALRLEPGHADALELRLGVDLMLGRLDHALAVHEHLAAYHPDRATAPSVQLARAEALARLGRHDHAASVLDELLADHPEQPDALRMLAGLATRLGQPQRAAAALERLIELQPDEPAPRRQLARLVGHSDAQRAIDLLTWPGHTDDPVVRLDAARLCLHLDRLRDARDLIDAVMLDHGDDAAACIEAGNLADRFGDRSGARALLEFAAATRGPHQPVAINSLAVSFLHSGAFADAAVAYHRLARRAMRDHQPDPLADAYAGLAVAGWCAQRPRLARRARARLLALCAGDEAATRKAIAAVWRHAAAARVIDATRRQHEPNPTTEAAPDPVRSMLAHAAESLARAAEQNPDHADTHYQLAVVQHELGHADDAATALERALAVNPDYADARRLSMKLAAMRPAETPPVELDAHTGETVSDQPLADAA
ncbi:MAG: tetratricopeptide repeat protein [Planctomycetota bacterium]